MPKRPPTDAQLRALAGLALQPMPSHAPTALNPAPAIPLGRGDRIGPAVHSLAEFAAMPPTERKRVALRESLDAFNAPDVGTLGESLMMAGPLDLSTAARMARAADMGFDTSKTWYHGTARLDRIADKKGFDPKRATSGPSAYFTDSPEIAGNYATNKADTSLEMPASYADWFKFDVPGTKHKIDVDRHWHRLPYEERQAVTDALGRVGMDDAGNIIVGADASAGPGGAAHWEHTLKEHRGNALAAARDVWLDSGILFDQEEKFLDVLRGAGVKGAIYDNPHRTHPGVVAVHARVQNPLNVRDADAIAKVLPELEAAAKGRRAPRQSYGADAWDKRTRDPKEWIAALKSDGENGFAWTSIPDWVTEKLRSLGYDGIIDRGGKMGGDTHQVLVPFEANQVRAPWARFDPKKRESRDLLAGLAGASVATGIARSDR